MFDTDGNQRVEKFEFLVVSEKSALCDSYKSLCPCSPNNLIYLSTYVIIFFCAYLAFLYSPQQQIVSILSGALKDNVQCVDPKTKEIVSLILFY